MCNRILFCGIFATIYNRGNTMKKSLIATILAGFFATSANAGIIIPAGDWTLDINGNVNAFANYTKAHGDNAITGGLATRPDSRGETKAMGINTGLLPSWLGFTGKTRQNDLDVEFTISIQPNVSDNSAAGDVNTPLNRQAYVSFGDKSWGSIKLGKDLGIFASDAILNDMTLLGVGAGAAMSGAATTNGGIGTGYIYPAWKGQIAYTTPNMNGLQATVGITNPNQASQNSLYQDRFGLEGKVSYTLATGAVTTKVWTSGASYKVTPTSAAEYNAWAADVGVNATAGALGLTGYYYKGEGAGTTTFGSNGVDASGNKRDSDGYYVQATYALPIKTKLGVAYGKSNLDKANGSDSASLLDYNERYTVGAYHPLTKHLNLVAEYNRVEAQAHSGVSNHSDTISTGAILFF
jgi:predicted porin